MGASGTTMDRGLFLFLLSSVSSSFFPPDPRSTESMIIEAGYEAQAHKVVTDDDYILTVYRIVGTGPVIFLQHGMVGSSTVWMLAGPQHKTLDPDNDDEYWQFAQDEMSKYDLPSQLNYVLQITNKKKIFYMGHSMGTTTYMAMNSMDPTWADKVELAVFLAPVAFVAHMRSPVRLLAPFSDQVQFVVDHMGLGFSARPGEFLPTNWMSDLLTKAACGNLTPLRPV